MQYVLVVCRSRNSQCKLHLKTPILFEADSQNCEKRPIASLCLSVRLPFCMKRLAPPIGQIFVKFNIDYFWINCQKIHVSLKSDKNNGTLHENQGTFL